MAYNDIDNDLKTFARFIFVYEREIKNMSNEAHFKKFNSEAFYNFKQIKNKIKRAKNREILSTFEPESNLSLSFTVKYNIILDFCRHLRNSFCHALLIKEKKGRTIVLKITDKQRGKETCKGYIDYSSVIDFIILLTKDFDVD